jgi:hypothetical protein
LSVCRTKPAGPAEKLDETRICQPAMFVCNLVAVEWQSIRSPDSVKYWFAFCVKIITFSCMQFPLFYDDEFIVTHVLD